MLQDMLVKSTE